MRIDLSSIRTAVTVGASVAELVGKIALAADHARHDPTGITELVTELAEGLPSIVEAVKAGTAAEDEPDAGDDYSGGDLADETETAAAGGEAQDAERVA